MRVKLQYRRMPRAAVAGLVILIGVVGRILLGCAPNVEPVLILSMLAGAILGSLYTVIVPVAIMAVSDVYFYFVPYGGMYPTFAILGLAAFVYSGFLFVSAMGGFAMRRRLLWRTRTIAMFTTISIPLTVAFDVWTAFGNWVFLSGGASLADVYAKQVLFTLIHVFSSLLFAPILGTAFLGLHLHGVPTPVLEPAEAPDSGSQ